MSEFNNSRSKLKNKLLPTLLGIVVLAIGWQLIALQIAYPAIFPPLIELLKETVHLSTSGNFWLEIGYTVVRGLIGFGVAFVFAGILATISVFSSFWKTFFNPIIIVIRSVPVISLALIALLWFAPTQLPVFIALITMFPILYQNNLTGLERTDRRFLEMATVFGKSKTKQFFDIYLPTAKAPVFDGIKTAMGFGWRSIIIGEVLSQPLHGIGTAMKEAQVYINVSELIAWTVIAVLISFAFEYLIKLIQKITRKKRLQDSSLFNIKNISQTTIILSIKATNLKKKFNDTIILNSFNYDFKSDKLYCLKGISGQGKSTFLRLLVGLEKPDSGEIVLAHNSSFGYSFQDIRLLPWLTISENIEYGLNVRLTPKGTTDSLITFLLEKMELKEHADKYPHELSGGQQQRVGLARALASQSDILLLDEPLTGLDKELKLRIISFLSEWFAAYKPLVIWATHENVELIDSDIVIINEFNGDFSK